MGTEPTGLLLRAGELVARLDGVDLRDVRWHGEEVLRHVYVAVRPPDWSTVPGTVEDLHVTSAPDGFSVRCRVVHVHPGGDLAFRWDGEVSGRASGGGAELLVRMTGSALTGSRYNRIGLCLLHPPALAGTGVVQRSADGTHREGALPVLVGPQAEVDGVLQPVLGPFRAVVLQHCTGPVEITFSGDDFETEDQRNWTDASFKTYSTPLALGGPHRAAEGQAIVQEARVLLPVPAPGAARRRAPGGTVTVGPATGVRLGGVGLLAAPGGAPADPAARALLRGAGLDHLRVEVVRADDVGPQAALAADLGVPVHLALHLPEDAGPAEARALASDVLTRTGVVPLAYVLVLPDARGREVLPADVVAAVRDVAAAVRPGVPVGGGSARHLCELNRRRPAPGSLAVGSFPVMPQEHAGDDTTLVQSHQVLGDVVATARSFLGDVPLTVGPVTLRAHRPGSADPAEADPRQAGAFAAAWLLGELAGLLTAGADTVTAFATAGPHGVVEEGGGATPALAVLAAVAGLRGGRVRAVAGLDPVRTAALAVSPPEGPTHLLLADLTGTARRMTLPAGAGTVRAHGPSGWEPVAGPIGRGVPVRPCGLLLIEMADS